MKLAVSLAALAVVLMTSSALAKDPKTDSSTTNAKPTAANAAAFIARAEKELFDYSVDASRVAWVNATYITDDRLDQGVRSVRDGVAVRLDEPNEDHGSVQVRPQETSDLKSVV